MRHSTKKYLEDELSSYRKMDRYISDLREEITHPWQETDTNIGGERVMNNVSTVEIKATRLVTDKRLKRMQEVKQAIEDVYEACNDEGRQFMEVYYFSKEKKYTVVGVADRINVSKSKAYDIRNAILKQLADELGIMS